ncbi:MAG: hypothetical protein PHW82_17230, partial [Bacteroidales bacterium]|nr:hypothetical protein [Bacteroidales bacterium]
MRRSSIDNKIKEKQDELAIIQAESELLPQRMADALDTGDPETALEIEKKITESSAKITELERSIELLSKAIPKGDPELFANAIEAHKVKRQKVKAVLMELKSIESQIINIHKELMEVQEVLQPKLKSTLNILSSHHPDE